MLTIRRSGDRGHANHGWLDSYHSFSFADYYDPTQMGFHALRVINEDRIAPGGGFPTHSHRDMEILTYMLDGGLAHRDSMGNERVIRPFEVQGMSAGTGITHSEFNASKEHPCHLLQIWIMPHTKSVTPSYGEWRGHDNTMQAWALAASEDGAEGSIRIHQDARLFIASAEAGKSLPLSLNETRYGWLQVATGEVEVAGQMLHAGDGASFNAASVNHLDVKLKSELLLFDLA